MEKKTGTRLLAILLLFGCGIVAVTAILLLGPDLREEAAENSPAAYGEGGENATGGVVTEIDGSPPSQENKGAQAKETLTEPGPGNYQGIRARIMDADTGKPVPLFSAWVLPAGKGDIRKLARGKTARLFHNDAGLFSFTRLDEGRYDLLVKSTGYQDLVVPGLEVPQKRDLLEFSLGRGMTISGRVGDASGQPLRDMLVILKFTPFSPGDPAPSRNTAVTDRDGRFVFGDLVEGEYDILLKSFSAPLDSVTGIYLTRGSSFSKNFVIPLYATLLFHITDRFGHLLPNVHITLRSKEGRSFRAKTGLKGETSIKHVPPGEYELVLFKSLFKLMKEQVIVSSLARRMSFERTLEFEKK